MNGERWGERENGERDGVREKKDGKSLVCEREKERGGREGERHMETAKWKEKWRE